MTFKQLRIGQTFDFAGGDFISFWLRCTKISARKYQDARGTAHTIGSTSCPVWNVGQ
jgi:hypothetical protein